MTSVYEQARYTMIHQQVRPWEITDDRVLAVMAEIPRERFVPDAYRGLAYGDLRIPLAHGECMLEPRLMGALLQALGIQPDERVLEIGTGSGYGTACLVRLGARVLSLECHGDLADRARERLKTEPKRRWEIRTANGLEAIPEGPFEAIALTGSLPDAALLKGFQEQLAPEGRLFVILGRGPAMTATLIRRLPSGGFAQSSLFETRLPPLRNLPVSAESFVF